MHPQRDQVRPGLGAAFDLALATAEGALKRMDLIIARPHHFGEIDAVAVATLLAADLHQHVAAVDCIGDGW